MIAKDVSGARADLPSLAKNDALRWNPYMGECLKVLEREQGSPLDAILINQVEIDRVVQKASLALVRRIRTSTRRHSRLTLFVSSRTTPHSRRTTPAQCCRPSMCSPCKQISTASSTTCRNICNKMVCGKQHTA